MNADVSLITIMHDPDGALYAPLQRALPVIDAYPGAKYVAVSEATDARVVAALSAHQFTVFRIEKKGAAHARRQIAARVQSYGHDFYHYCDLDRLVIWALHAPEEWSFVREQITAHDYTIIGRTEAAFRTHPRAWQDTEVIVNRIFSLAVGTAADVTAGSCGFSRRALTHIVRRSQAAMTDAEWPLLVCDAYGVEWLGAIRVDGLLYTEHNRDRAPDEQTAWHNRLRLAHTIARTVQEWKEG